MKRSWEGGCSVFLKGKSFAFLKTAKSLNSISYQNGFVREKLYFYDTLQPLVS